MFRVWRKPKYARTLPLCPSDIINIGFKKNTLVFLDFLYFPSVEPVYRKHEYAQASYYLLLIYCWSISLF